jgi:hypothetical protein
VTAPQAAASDQAVNEYGVSQNSGRSAPRMPGFTGIHGPVRSPPFVIGTLSSSYWQP